MSRYITRRLLRLIPVLFIVTLATTFMLNIVPGDPAVEVAGESATPEVLARVNEQYGFKESPLKRYGQWLGDVVHGDFGTSYRTK
jgi:peptide/nickel transport system permease protein